MKKIVSFTLAVLSILACQREVESPIRESLPTHTVTVTAGFDQTKTSYTEEGKFSWVAGDRIDVLVTDGTVIKQVPLTTAEGGPMVQFTGEVEDGFVLTGIATYSDNLFLDTEELAWSLPGTIEQNTLSPLSGLPLFGFPDVNGLIQFKTAVGIVKFTVENIPAETCAASLETFGEGAPALSGWFEEAPQDGVIQMSALTDGGHAITVEAAPTGPNTTLSYYFFVPTGTLPAEGTKFSLLDAENNVIKDFTFKKEVAVAANAITNIAPLAFDPVKVYNRQSDSLALVAIYNASKGAEWAKGNWDLEAEISTWGGVTVDAETNRVTALKLTTGGTITEEWTLPEEVGELTAVLDFRINGNKLTGSLPSTLFDLKQLQKLYLQNNNLTGELSPLMGNLVNLIELYIDRNKELGGNLEWIGTLTKLTGINIANTSIGGSIPATLVNCQALKNFMAYSNKLSGEIPDFWDQLPNIGVLQLYGNPDITGPIPYSIGSLINATGIQLKECNLTGNIPASFSGLERCGNLQLNGNKLSGVVPEEVQAHAKWQATTGWKYETNILPQQDGYGLYLEASQETDLLALKAIYKASDGANWAKNNWDLEADISTWSGVTVDAETHRVTALKLTTGGIITEEWVLPEEVGFLTEVTDFRINGNKLSGKLPQSLFGLKKLQKLYFQNNNLTGELSYQVGNLPELTELYVDRNKDLEGNLEWIGNLTKLTSINISVTSIGGSIPETLVNCQALKNFMAYSNKLSGEIPDFWDQLPNIGVLQLYSNPDITGPIPYSMGSLKNATGIQLKECNLTGNIPASFGGLEKCGNLQLNGNKLSGVVPEEVQAHAKWQATTGWKYETNILPQQEGYGLTLE